MRASRGSVEQIRDNLYIVPSTACTDTTCASITIAGCTFEDFNFLKASIEILPLVTYVNPMKYQGLLLTLSDFYGKIIIRANTFTSLQFKFAHCNLFEEQQTVNTSSLWSNTEAYQIKTIMKIDVRADLEIVSNVFSECNSVSGLIFLKKYSESAGILIHSNTFTQNSALFDTISIRLDIESTIWYGEAITTTMQ